MMPIQTRPEMETTAGERALRKASRRLLPFFFVLYIVAFLNRANVAFARIPMVADLGFSEAVFGFGAGVFFVGYFALGIPGAMIVERRGARLWMALFLLVWGLCTMAAGLVHSAGQFYTARFVLGLAQAGFFPGVIVYLTRWFPAPVRAKALAGFILAVPISFVVGAPLSTWCLQIGWLDLPGWRWLFLLQGLPAVVLGLVTPFYLADSPGKAKWLEPDEREWLEETIAAEQRAKRAASAGLPFWRALVQPYVLLLAGALFFAVVAMFGYLFWLPTTIQKHSGLSTTMTTLLSGAPFLLATVAVWWNGRSSDRRGERKWHATVPLLVCGAAFAMVAIPGQPFALILLWLSITGMCLWAWGPPYWVLPTLTLGQSGAAASVGLVNSIGNFGGFVGPFVVGQLLSAGLPFSWVVLLLSGAFVVSAGLIASLRVPQTTQSSRAGV
jgi:ACS family tartrate transporter-like MFS transporter